ncbi:MAG: arginase family protein [Flavobacteriales bacterium]
MVALSGSVDLGDFKMALMFVPEYRHSAKEGSIDSQSLVDSVCRLYSHHADPTKILLLGELILGDSAGDTESALTHIVDELLKKRVLPIIVGGGRELTYAVYRAFAEEEQIVNVCSVDPFLNIETNNTPSYIGRIIKEQPNFLFNYSNLGYQTYLVNPEELKLADELYFDTYRLGEVRGNIAITEPVIRSSEIFSLSIDSLKSSDFSGALNPQPNGLYAEEVCQMLRYAGIGEKLKAVVISDVGHLTNLSDRLLLAEMLWCLVDGLNVRKSELPSSRNDSFLKYRVSLKDDEFQLVFYKSLQTDRWWMEVPVPPEYANKYRKHHLIPCGYEDYQQATQDDLPDRWWRAYKKML